MTDSVLLTRFWADYPLDTTVAEVSPRFRVGPFRGELTVERGPHPDGHITLSGIDGDAMPPLSLPPEGALWLERGNIAYRIERTSLAPRAARRLRPDLGIVLGTAFAAVVAATLFSWAAMSVPELLQGEPEPAATRDSAPALAGDAPRAAPAISGLTPRLSVRAGSGAE